MTPVPIPVPSPEQVRELDDASTEVLRPMNKDVCLYNVDGRRSTSTTLTHYRI